MPRTRRRTIQLPEPGPDDAVAEWYHSRGLRVPRECVWVNGVDVTDTLPISEWPWPYSMYRDSGWRPWGWVGETPANGS